MYLKPWKIRIDYALSVVSFATAVCADKQKAGLPTGSLYRKVTLSQLNMES